MPGARLSPCYACVKTFSRTTSEHSLAKLKDIAEELGLSPATVSRALNGYPEVGEATRARVVEAAERLGYAPNPIARRLVGGRSGFVGMVVPRAGDVSVDPGFVDIVAGLSEALSDRDLDLVIHVDARDRPVDAYERLIRRNTLDGFIVTAPAINDQRLPLLRERGVPFAVHGPAGEEDDYFDIDNFSAGRMAVEHIAERGHARIAFLNGPAHLAYARDRARGYEAALRNRKIAVDGDLLLYEAPTHPAGERLARQLLDGADPPTAILCSSTAIASGVYAAADARGLVVGRDLAVLAHDDAPPHIRAEDFRPPLTVTAAPLSDACEPIARMLARRLDQPDAPPEQIVGTITLIARESTGPAPQ